MKDRRKDDSDFITSTADAGGDQPYKQLEISQYGDTVKVLQCCHSIVAGIHNWGRDPHWSASEMLCLPITIFCIRGTPYDCIKKAVPIAYKLLG